MELAWTGTQTGIRDSKDPDTATLTIPAPAFHHLLTHTKHTERRRLTKARLRHFHNAQRWDEQYFWRQHLAEKGVEALERAEDAYLSRLATQAEAECGAPELVTLGRCDPWQRQIVR